MRVLVGIVANDFARVTVFSACVTALQQQLHRDGTDATVDWRIGTDYVGARNALVEQTLDERYDALWFIDDDHAFPATIVQMLIRHDVPIVVPVCLKRFAPFTPVTYVERVNDRDDRYLPLYLPDMPDAGLIEVEAGGSAGMLVKREVFESLEPPWFELTPLSEDLVFCERAKQQAGFRIYCDLSARIGHVTTATITPVTSAEGEWMMGVTVGLDAQIAVPFEMMAAQS